MVLLLLMVSTRGECVSNSGWWVAMHLVLTLGKRRQIARLEWERGEGGFSGRQGPVDIWPCVLRSPHGPLLRPLLSSFSSSSLWISRLRNMKDPPHLHFILRWKDRLPVLASGTIEAHLLNGLISQIAQSAGINNIVFRCHRASNDVIWASTIIACRRIVRLHSQYDPRFCRLPLKHACRLFCHQEPSALSQLLKMQRNWQTTPPNPVSCVFRVCPGSLNQDS